MGADSSLLDGETYRTLLDFAASSSPSSFTDGPLSWLDNASGSSFLTASVVVLRDRSTEVLLKQNVLCLISSTSLFRQAAQFLTARGGRLGGKEPFLAPLLIVKDLAVGAKPNSRLHCADRKVMSEWNLIRSQRNNQFVFQESHDGMHNFYNSDMVMYVKS